MFASNMVHQCNCFTLSGRITRRGSCLGVLSEKEAAGAVVISFGRENLYEAEGHQPPRLRRLDSWCPACSMTFATPEARAAHRISWCDMGRHSVYSYKKSDLLKSD